MGREWAGRDHWGHVFLGALVGCGVRGGQVYSASDRYGGYPSEKRVTPADLTATILHCLGFDPWTELPDVQALPGTASTGRVIHDIY
jgi:hypothetical protein